MSKLRFCSTTLWVWWHAEILILMYIHSATHLSVILDCADMNILDMIDDGGVRTLVLGA